jgi:hypothetical protein
MLQKCLWASGLSVASLAICFAGCGSTHTVDSKDVARREEGASSGSGTKTGVGNGSDISKGGAQKSMPPRDFHQRYSFTFEEREQKALVAAQFRVRTSRGDTVRLSAPGSVLFQGSQLRIVDGDVVNAVTEALNWLTYIPIFSLLRTGTFYTQSFPGVRTGTLVFNDDDNNKVTQVLIAPEARANFRASDWKEHLESGQEHSFDVTAAQGLDVSCALKSEHREQVTKGESPKTESTQFRIATARAVFQNGSYVCFFKSYEVKEHKNAIGPVEGAVSVSRNKNSSDAFGRGMVLHESLQIRQSL